MKTSPQLTRVIVVNDGSDGRPAYLHAVLLSTFPEDEVTHDAEFTVVLEYSKEEVMKLTLAQIRTDALNRLPREISFD